MPPPKLFNSEFRTCVLKDENWVEMDLVNADEVNLIQRAMRTLRRILKWVNSEGCPTGTCGPGWL